MILFFATLGMLQQRSGGVTESLHAEFANENRVERSKGQHTANKIVVNGYIATAQLTSNNK